MNFMLGMPEFSHQDMNIHIAMPSAASSSSLPHSTYHHHNNQDGGGGGGDQDSQMVGGTHETVVEKEHMFDKVVTPSDVGKLNRLVIPKQHAEKYFPLDSSGGNEKGLLLNFEDRHGKPWRFRYSYWNSSQSYVMTKGWSRFVKDKKLDAGDVVSFQRGVGEVGKDRLFIDWRRRPDAPDHHHHHQFSFQRSNNIHPWNLHFLTPPPLPPPSSRDHQYSHFLQSYNPYSYNPSVVNGNPIVYLRSAALGGGVGGTVLGSQQVGLGLGMMQTSSHALVAEPTAAVFESVPVVKGQLAASKRLRLFGVNVDCPISESDISTMQLLPNDHLPFDSSSSSYCSIPTYNYNDGDKGKSTNSTSLDLEI